MNRDSYTRTEGSPAKYRRTLKKWLDRLADALKRLAGKVVGFVAEHTWALIVFAAGLIGVWLMQRVQGSGEGGGVGG